MAEAQAVASGSSGRASVKSSNGSESGNMELKDMPKPAREIPIEEDIMQLARMGEVAAIQKLFDSGKFDAKYKDEDGITPLHWAAINNQFALCKYLLEAGVDINAKGGDSGATPAMWAAQRCHYYVVNLLLQHGADPLLTDAQGYNMLHLATFEGNVFLILLLLHQNIPVDVTDSHGHTSLMWAAYKGFPACVELYLRWGANVYATDEQGFTALHWALVKGPQVYVSQNSVQKLIEYGSDRFAMTSTGKTPAITAEEMKCTQMWHRALADCGYDDEGHPTTIGLPFASLIKDRRGFAMKFFFLWPFLQIFCVFWLLSHMVVYAAVPLAITAAYGLQWAALQVGKRVPGDLKQLQHTPFIAGIFAGTCFWIGISWLTALLPRTFSTAPFTNVVFGVLYGLCSYFYYRAAHADPGYISKQNGRNQEKETVEELLRLWKLDEQNFCMQCMVRKPLRSKHCRRCGRCVAKQDHHCPWINNCVAINNLRHFFLYLICMAAGIIVLIRLVLTYLELTPDSPTTECNVVSDQLCRILLKDPYIILLTAFTSLQLIWITMLLSVQVIQIARAQTTLENMRGHQHGEDKAFETAVAAVAAGSTSLEGAELTHAGLGPDPAPAPARPRRDEGSWARWKKLLGLDTFVATAAGGLDPHRHRRQRNPFSRGVVTNCRDFWLDPAPIFGAKEGATALLEGEVVNYAKMYETPLRMRYEGGVGGTTYRSVAGEEEV